MSTVLRALALRARASGSQKLGGLSWRIGWVVLRYASTITEPRFIPSHLDEIECVEEYRPGGFHPIALGDQFAHRRYRVIHKLGKGGSSTVWLARDQQKQSLVTLKALRADVSSKPPNETPELVVPRSLQAAFPDSDGDIQTLRIILPCGPEWHPPILISPLAVMGSRRLRGDLGRKAAKQTANAIYRMHSTGWVHGDLTTSIYFFACRKPFADGLTPKLRYLGSPETEEVRTRGGQPRGIHTPPELVAPIENSQFVHASHLKESIVISDFGQSYAIASPPSDYMPGTVLNYLAPETRFEERTGCPLFEPFFGSDTDILVQTVGTLGRLPDPWWGSFEDRAVWFEEDGEPKVSRLKSALG
ncbi:hypothetical protein BJV77DRAFT_1145910 [Russula vinacea]|nr:hypothetical protein BJV77DRAFT_1145910 [Russula vinacea]